MKRKIMLVALSSLLAFKSVVPGSPVYALDLSTFDNLLEQQDTKLNRIIYVTNGEGTLGAGDGTQGKPYQNIRTALENIQDGETLKLVGTVQYTRYNVHTDNSALPLFIDKNITIEGIDESSGLSIKTRIQLGADVTFKNMKLEMVPEVMLGRSTENIGARFFGQPVPRSATIYLAGHKLTLDNVNTKMGTSVSQDDERPYISGGAYKGLGTIGNKSVLTIINPNSETKISAIYAGDYWNDRTIDVEINLDGRLLDTIVYTGGIDHTLNGDVYVNIFGKSNITGFDKTNQNGNLYVRLMENYFSASLNITDVNELVLNGNSKIIIPKNGKFEATDVILNKKAVIDFRDMQDNPMVRGDFKGVENVSDPEDLGVILLNNDHTLEIQGNVSGLTTLNANQIGSINPFLDGHSYIRANANSTGDFSIEGTIYEEFDLKKETNGNITTWTTIEQAYNEEPSTPTPTVTPTATPKPTAVPTQAPTVTPTVTPKPTAVPTQAPTVTPTVTPKPTAVPTQAPTVTPTATPKPTAVPTQAPVVVPPVAPPVVLPQTPAVPTQAPTVTPTQTPTQTVTPTPTPTITPKIKLNKSAVTLYTSGTTTSWLKATVDGASNQVTYTSSNTKVATVNKYGKITAVGNGTATITARVNGLTATCKVTVKKAYLSLNKYNATIYTTGSKTVQLTAKTVGGSQKISYASSNKKVAVVDKNGKVTAVGTGTANIVVKANGLTKKCKITVKKATLTVSNPKLSIQAGKTAELNVKAIPARKITYTSSNKKVATVTSKGVIKGLKPGTVKIKVRCNGITRTVTVTVKK